jgi:hypothetical protein
MFCSSSAQCCFSPLSKWRDSLLHSLATHMSQCKMAIRTLQAIFHRDEHILEKFYTKQVISKGTATDDDGKLHLHVLMGRMCNFEPAHVGKGSVNGTALFILH